MRKKAFLLLAILLTVGLLLSSCSTQDAGEWELEWHPVNPPREGLRCWVAVREIPYYGYGFSYCEAIE